MKTFMKTLLAVITAVSVISATTAASAQDVPPPSSGGAGWMTQGAEILPMGKYAFEARVGFPSTDLGVHIPIMPVFEITPFLTLDYLAFGGWGAYFGDTIGVQLKGQVWSQGPHAISLGGDLGLAFNYGLGIGGAFDLALQIGGPELKYSYRWDNPRIAVIGGLRMPIRVWMLQGNGWAEIPILFNAGFEYNVIPNLNIHANFEIGPSIFTGGFGPGARNAWFHAGFQFGISYLW